MHIVTGFIFLAAVFIFLFIYLILFGSKIEISNRALAVIRQGGVSLRDKELSEPLFKRAVQPLLNRIVKLASKMLPSEKEASLSKKLVMAGKPGRYGPKEFVAIKLIIAILGPAIILLADQLLLLENTVWLTLTISAVVAGWILPDIYLQQKITQRKEEVEKDLPGILDLITVSVEAGTGFDGALLKVVEKSKGILASEFLTVLQECKMGKSRKDALKDMADRVNVEDLSTFIGFIITSEQLGIGISNVMRLQSDQMRRKRRQRAEEKAMKAPVKMMIPMVTCIFPSIFVILLGPAAISLYQAFLL